MLLVIQVLTGHTGSYPKFVIQISRGVSRGYMSYKQGIWTHIPCKKTFYNEFIPEAVFTTILRKKYS